MKTPIFLFTFVTGLFSITAASAMRLALCNENTSCSTQLVFSSGATPGFDKGKDKEMFVTPKNKMNYIYSVTKENRMMFINYCPVPETYFSVDLQVSIQDAGTFSFVLEDMTEDLSGVRFTLTDLFTGKSYPLEQFSKAEISFENKDLDTKRNFVLHVYPALKATSVPVNCSSAKDGSIHVSFNDKTEWQAKLNDGNKQLGFATGTNGEAEFENLKPGLYFVEIWKGDYKITEEILPVANTSQIVSQFTFSRDTINGGSKIFTENTSKGGSHWYWDFGDGTTSSQYSPSHEYKTPGIYTITLYVADIAGCVVTSSKTVKTGNINFISQGLFRTE